MTTLQIFNVEHGACALLTCPLAVGGATRMLIDCGHNATTGFYPGEYLQRMGVRHLDMMVVTNYDEDHVSGFPDFLRRNISIGHLERNMSVTPGVIAQLKSETGMGNGIAALSRFAAGRNGALTLLGAPYFPNVYWSCYRNPCPLFDDENNLSHVLRLSINGWNFLFPGDLERAGWIALLNANAEFRNMMQGIDVLVAAHHGRENGVCQEIFDKFGCSPKIVVISDDYRQYSTQNTTAYYGSKCKGVNGFRRPGLRKVLTTRSDGDILFSFNGADCTVS